ncbi:ferredoxin reductase [Nocardioides stalactiti]|uniref:ferredoxin reductase n=1 Tax=Nocardioides stalactiti TaxID=2755356 RepID=UPI0028AA2999|nr:ferredoxin reductase [Nocardioides stalactiti]
MSSISLSAPVLARSAQRGALRRRLRAAADAALTPLSLDDVLDGFHPLRSGADLRGKIVAVQAETADAATIVIKPGRDWRGHEPGQYLQVGVDVDGVRLWRSYSLTHGPRRDGHISITVKAIPDGVVSNHLVHRARAGEMIHLQQAAGDFVLPLPVPDRLLLVTAGSGVTPVIGMLRNLFSRSVAPTTDIVLLHVNQTEPDSIFKDELRALGASSRITLVEHFDDRDGVLDLARLESLVPDIAARTSYACGPSGLLDALEQWYDERGLALTTERFRTALLADAGEGGTVTFADGIVLEADGATPILDAAEAAGVLMPSGCRMGICMGCVLPMKEGAIRDLRNGEVTVVVPGEAGPGGVKIQTCISAAAGDCHLDH